jgi:predicted branched-subunit amino acid permease
MTIDAIDTRPVAPGRSRPLLDGARAILPMALGVVPFGVAIGAAIQEAGIDRLAAWAGSFLLLSGSAHLTMVELLGKGAAPVVAVAAALMINARLLMYGAGLAPWFPSATKKQRLLLAIPLIDQLYLTAVARFEHADLDEHDRRRFWFGAAFTLCGIWVVAQTVGLFAGSNVPRGAGLHAAAPLALVGLLATAARGRPAVTTAVVAGTVAVVAAPLPHHSSMLVATLAGIAAGSARSRS